ncbi:putative uncharacterized protein [Clostridium sp. CAG:277]|jgi:uncharacterized protein YqhQ|nr:DUF1385 domain-containing protein [Clostridium sp. OM07-9AC]CDE68598.1 putative uncharacterized protein [Clostridium sp. CAG:277]
MKSSGIGGQAVLEGVMMRNRDKYAVAVRKPDGEISVKNWNTGSVRDRHILLRLPVIRGVAAFIESLILGIKTLTYSSSFIEEDVEKAGQVEVAEVSDRKEMLENILIVALSILLAIGFFMILPFAVSKLFQSRVHSQMMLSVIEAALKILLFLGYVVAISFLSDIKRTLMYHGAEHKTINCVENGLDLTVENVKTQSRYHRRCGTSFLLVVMLVSIIFFFFIQIDNLWLQMLYRILLVPVVAGVSFELIQFVGNSDNRLVLWISTPGLWLQKLTTREPDDGMIEVAIASVEAVFDWRAYQAEVQKEKARRARRKKKAAKKEEEENSFARPDEEIQQMPVEDQDDQASEKPESVDESVWSQSGAGTVTEEPERQPKREETMIPEKENKKEEKTAGKKKQDDRKKPVEEKKQEGRKARKSVEEKKQDDRKLEKPVEEKKTGDRKIKKPVEEKKQDSREEKKSEEKTASEKRERRGEERRKPAKKSGSAGIFDRLPKSKKRRELEEREARYRNRAAERMRQIKEQEAREAAHEKAYQEAKKRRAERLAATQELPKLDEGRTAAPKVTVEQDADDLKSLDRFFDDKKN